VPDDNGGSILLPEWRGYLMTFTEIYQLIDNVCSIIVAVVAVLAYLDAKK
jgi:hypothetical protein